MSDRRPKLSTLVMRIEQAVKAASLLAVLAYLALVVLYLLPTNPLQLQLWPAVHGVVGRFFDQSWNMFSPIPASGTRTILARCHGGQKASDWIDMTTSLTREARLLSADRRLASYMLEVLREEIDLRSRERDARSDDPVSMEHLRRARVDVHERWVRIGSVVCGDAFRDQIFDSVELKYRERPALPWSLRGSGVRPAEAEDTIGMFPIKTGLVRPRLFSASARR